MFALELFHDYVYQDMKKMKQITEGLWAYLCVCVSGVPAHVATCTVQN